MAKRKNKKVKKEIAKHGFFIKIKRLIPYTIIAAMFGFLSWAYFLYIDFKEGKWGGALEIGILSGENSFLDLKEDRPVYIYYSIPQEAKKSKILIPVQLEIHNSANVTDQSVRMSLKYDKESLRHVITEKYMIPSGFGLKSDLKHDLIISKEYDYSVYGFESLPQKSRRNITDAAFSFNADESEVSVPFFSSRYGLNVEVSTYSLRDRERNWIFRYRGLVISQEEKVILWMKDWYAKKIALDLRKDSTFIEYLSGLIFNEEVLVYTFSPDFSYISHLDLYVPNEDPKEYRAFKFNPYVWSLLFEKE